jgi:hypothetical protein
MYQQVTMCQSRPAIDTRAWRCYSLWARAALPPGATLHTATPADVASLARILTLAFGEPWDEGRVRRVLLDAPDVVATYLLVQEGIVLATPSARFIPEQYPESGYVRIKTATAAAETQLPAGWIP